MNKCHICNKNVTKKSPALTCSRCDVIVHEKTECSGLTTKQRAALRAADTLEWVCSDCHSTSRKTSFIGADDDEEDSDDPEGAAVAPDVKKLIEKLNKEVHKIVMKELADILKSVKHASDKIDDYEKEMKQTTETIKNLERKNTALKNQNAHLVTKVAAIEQRLEVMEQSALSNYIEIAEIPFQDGEDPVVVANTIGKLLQIQSGDDDKQVRAARRLPARAGKTGAILVQLQDETLKTHWIEAGRDAKIVASSVISTLSGEDAAKKIFVREALTGRMKFLLSRAKTILKEEKCFKFVWCKYGKIFARKTEQSKIYLIRTETDVDTLAAQS
ncbi:hypothetical protein O0L34_g2424 [Tuta absoluta]|nr:hypothetical protein O0L34_g2424 [Tuta absoluta]